MAKLRKRLLAAPFVVIAAIVVLFEEWRWDDLRRIAASVGGMPLFRKIESFIAGLPPYAALATFGVPSMLLIPVKLFALYLIAYGQPIVGLMMFIGARIVGTALVARIFDLTKHNLFRIGWFTWLYERFLDFKTQVNEAIKSTGSYKAAHRLRLRLRAALVEFSRGRRTFWRSR